MWLYSLNEGQSMIKIRLSRVMGEKRISIAELSRMTKLHRNGITKIYNEETDGIKFETLNIICNALNCKLEDIIEYIPDDDPD